MCWVCIAVVGTWLRFAQTLSGHPDATALDGAFQSLPFAQEIIATVIGLASALIDNVPLVAATMGMYDLSTHPVDDRLWQ